MTSISDLFTQYFAEQAKKMPSFSVLQSLGTMIATARTGMMQLNDFLNDKGGQGGGASFQASVGYQAEQAYQQNSENTDSITGLPYAQIQPLPMDMPVMQAQTQMNQNAPLGTDSGTNTALNTSSIAPILAVFIVFGLILWHFTRKKHK